MTDIHGWHKKRIDYVTAFQQVPVERELYIKIPKGLGLQGKNSCEYILKLHRNTYGQKKSGRAWNQYLVKTLKRIGFKKYKIDECVFYKGKIMYALYIDDSILIGLDPTKIDNTLKNFAKLS